MVYRIKHGYAYSHVYAYAYIEDVRNKSWCIPI